MKATCPKPGCGYTLDSSVPGTFIGENCDNICSKCGETMEVTDD